MFPFFMFLILKLYHCKCPLVFESTLINKSYYSDPILKSMHNYFENNIKVSGLKKRIKMKMILSLRIPILPYKLSVGEPESLITVEMSIRERERFLIPG